MTILDAAALAEHAAGSVYTGALLAHVTEYGGSLRVPIAALADAWAATHPDNRYRLEFLAVAAPAALDPLDTDTVFEIAAVAAEGGCELPQAQAVYLARLHGDVVVTADPAAYRDRFGDILVEELP